MKRYSSIVNSEISNKKAKELSSVSLIWGKLKNAITWLKMLFLKKELDLTILGLQNAGKSTFVNILSNGKFEEDTIPTIGFNYFRKLKKNKVDLTIWDLGGQPRFRDSWEKYCRSSDCIIYVVDSADLGNLDVAKIHLHELLSSSSLNNIPLLVLANKNDLDNACNESFISQTLDLYSITDRLVAIYSISCKSQINIENVLTWLSKLNSNKINT